MDGSDPSKKSRAAPRLGAGRGVTMAEVGRIAGVSQVTVSRALSDPSKVSSGTLDRIRHAIEATGFVPNAVAGALASRRSRLVSALVPSITNITYSAMIQAFGYGMREHGYQILLSETGYGPDAEEAAISSHLSRRPDAMMLTGIRHTAQARRMLLGAGIPIVEVWDITDSPVDLCVGFSHAEAGRAVAEFVVEAGYRNAATISAGDERALRRRDAFAKRFAELTGTRVEGVVFEAQASLALGREGLAQLLDARGFSGGAVSCSSDLIALGVEIEAGARGLRIPSDIGVVGFGDQDFAAHAQPSLTSVRVDRAALGQIAAQAILDRLGGEAAPPTVSDIGFEIIRRDSISAA